MWRFRRRYRRLLREEQAGLIGRARMIKRWLERPLRVYSTSGVAVARWGGPVEARRAVSMRRQRLTMWWLGVAHGIPPETYYRYRLFEPERRSNARLYLHGEEHNRVLAMFVEHQAPAEAARIDDKSGFQEWSRLNRLPVVRTLATFVDGRLVEGDAVLPEADLFAKPADGRGGAGAVMWRSLGSGLYIDPDGEELDGDQVVATLERRALERPYILQERLLTHSALRLLSAGSLCTLRLVTGRPAGGEPVLLSASFGMPVGDSVVDNFHAGGICSAVDPSTGRLGPGARSLPEECLNVYERHPDTGATITGVVLPFFGDAVQLALRAHRAAPAIAFVGWDLALTDEGPLLMEANVRWDAAMPQVPSGRPLGATPYIPWLLDHLSRLSSQTSSS